MATQAVWSVRTEGVKAMAAALKALGETDAPYLHAAMQEVGTTFAREASTRAPGAIAGTVSFVGVKGVGTKVAARIKVQHPGAKPMEFGDFYGQRGHKSSAYHAYPKGQRARPFIGVVKGDGAVGATLVLAKELIDKAILAEFHRLASGGGE